MSREPVPIFNENDVMQGMREWRNIQSVVRTTFKLMHDTIMSQGRRIAALEEQLDQTAMRDEIEAALETKASREQLDRLMTLPSAVEALDARVDRKADAAQLREVREAVEQAQAQAQAQAAGGDDGGADSARAALRRLQREVAVLRDDVDAVGDGGALRGSSGRSRSQPRPASAAVVTELRDELQRVAEEMHARPTRSEVARRISQAFNENLLHGPTDGGSGGRSPSRSSRSPARSGRSPSRGLGASASLEARFSEMMTLLEEKAGSGALRGLQQRAVSRDELAEALRDRVTAGQMEARVAVNTEAVARELRDALVATQEELIAVLNKKAYKSDVQRALQTKVSHEELERVADAKADVADVREALALKADAAALSGLAARVDAGGAGGGGGGERTGGVPTADVVAAIREARSASLAVQGMEGRVSEAVAAARAAAQEVEALGRAVDAKAEERAVQELAASKASIDDVNASLLEVNKELDSKAEAEALRPLAAEQYALAQVVRLELGAGRWIWKSGRITRGGRVPWNVQSVNHCPENLLWEPDADRVTTVMPGLYAVAIGVFSDRMPRVRVLVNNETAFVVPSEADGEQPERKSKARVYRHSAGNVAGWTATEYLALPPRAQLSLAYSGPDGAQGFLALRKL